LQQERERSSLRQGFSLRELALSQPALALQL
jgi:hypothetical protein